MRLINKAALGGNLGGQSSHRRIRPKQLEHEGKPFNISDIGNFVSGENGQVQYKETVLCQDSNMIIMLIWCKHKPFPFKQSLVPSPAQQKQESD